MPDHRAAKERVLNALAPQLGALCDELRITGEADRYIILARPNAADPRGVGAGLAHREGLAEDLAAATTPATLTGEAAEVLAWLRSPPRPGWVKVWIYFDAWSVRFERLVRRRAGVARA